MSISADGAITSLIAFIFSVLYILGFFHEHDEGLKNKYPKLTKTLKFNARQHDRLLRGLVGIYRNRYVSLFILAAIFIATISPVTILMELEENVIGRTCGTLIDKQLFQQTVDITSCQKTAVMGGYSEAAMSFKDTRMHFLQISLWPLLAVLYGWAISALIYFIKDPDESIEDAIDSIPHLIHVLSIPFVLGMTLVAYIQSFIGT